MSALNSNTRRSVSVRQRQMENRSPVSNKFRHFHFHRFQRNETTAAAATATVNRFVESIRGYCIVYLYSPQNNQIHFVCKNLIFANQYWMRTIWRIVTRETDDDNVMQSQQKNREKEKNSANVRWCRKRMGRPHLAYVYCEVAQQTTLTRFQIH